MVHDAKEYYEFSWRENVTHFGLRAGQNRTAFISLSILLDRIKPKNIIEFGTGSGGLSVMLGIWCHVNGSGFWTYDINTDQNQHPNLLKVLGVSVIKGNVLREKCQEIIDLINRPGLTLVLCDGGNKNAELQRFAPHLKSGDYIMMHDYANDSEEFKKEIHGKYWDWHESFRKTGIEAGLVQMFEGLMKYAAWGCFKKT